MALLCSRILHGGAIALGSAATGFAAGVAAAGAGAVPGGAAACRYQPHLC